MSKERNCDYFRELIPLGVGSDLERDEQAELEKHIEKCAICKKEFDSFLSAFRTLGIVRKNLESIEKQGLSDEIKSHIITYEHYTLFNMFNHKKRQFVNCLFIL